MSRIFSEEVIRSIVSDLRLSETPLSVPPEKFAPARSHTPSASTTITIGTVNVFNALPHRNTSAPDGN